MRTTFGLRTALTVLVLIAIAPVFVVVVQGSLAEQRGRVGRAHASLQALVDASAAQQERQIEGARLLLTALSQPGVAGVLAGGPCSSQFDWLARQFPAYGGFGLIDPAGNLLCPRPSSGVAPNFADRPFFQRAMRTGGFTVGEYAVGRVTRRPVLTTAMPVSPAAGTPAAVLFASLDLGQIDARLDQLTVPPEVTLYVSDGAGTVLASTGRNARAIGQPMDDWLRAAARAGGVRSGEAADAGGETWVYSVRPVGEAQSGRVVVGATLSTSALLAPTTRRLAVQLAALSLITLAGAAIAWLFGDRIVMRPLTALLRRMEALQRQHAAPPGPPAPSRIHELAELNERIDTMSATLREREAQRDAALAAIGEQQRLLTSVLENMAEGVLVVDRDRRLLMFNEAAGRMLEGLRLDAPLALSGLYELPSGQPLQPDRGALTRALRGEHVARFLHRVGRAGADDARVLQGSARPLGPRDGEPIGAVAVFTDVTAAWRAEQELRDSERRYRSLFEANPNPMWIFDEETLRFLTVNDAAVAHYGYSREEFLAMTIADIRPREDVAPLRRYLAEERPALTRPQVWRHLLKDGRIILVEISSHRLAYEDRAAWVVLAHDITVRIEAEEALRQLNETLERRVQERTRDLAAANRELESFSYSVSHDLRAPLEVISGFGQALIESQGDRLDGRARHYLDRIGDNAKRMSLLIDDLLSLAQVSRAKVHAQPFDLAVVAQQVVERLRQRQPERDAQVVIESPLPCHGDARLLGIALDNLLGNAWKFSEHAAPARIRFGSRVEGGERVYFVSDNGAGFDMAYADKLFQPFQRLHKSTEFQGTGIGLATVQRIVVRHGGRIWAQARLGEGATFFFSLGERVEA